MAMLGAVKWCNQSPNPEFFGAKRYVSTSRRNVKAVVTLIYGIAEMAKKSKLKNVLLKQKERLGKTVWELCDADGNVIQAYSYFINKIKSESFNTRRCYALHGAMFVDYLIEAKAFGHITTTSHINAVIDSYPILLRDGSVALASRLKENLMKRPEDAWLIEVAEALNRVPMMPNSFSNIIASVNLFLKVSESLAQEASEKASLAGIAHDGSYITLVKALEGTTYFTDAERRKLRQNTMLGGVVRTRGEKISRPRSLGKANGARQNDLRNLEFPISYFIALVDAANSWRDKALWLLLGGCGLRISEALNLRWIDIHIPSRTVYILDPYGRHFGGDLTPQEKLRFKGRNVSITFFIPMFRARFFNALLRYIEEEYLPVCDKEDNSYVFQYIEESRRGVPLINVTYKALEDAFKAACRRANIPGPTTSYEKGWTLQSLRHMYGVYMLNDIPISIEDNIFGLDLSEVQLLMGHENIETTKHYARKKKRIIEAKVERADRLLLGLEEAEKFSLINDSRLQIVRLRT